MCCLCGTAIDSGVSRNSELITGGAEVVPASCGRVWVSGGRDFPPGFWGEEEDTVAVEGGFRWVVHRFSRRGTGSIVGRRSLCVCSHPVSTSFLGMGVLQFAG